MKRILALFLSFITAAALTACGGSQAAIKGGSGGTATVAQIMEDAGKQREAPAENTAEAPPSCICRMTISARSSA